MNRFVYDKNGKTKYENLDDNKLKCLKLDLDIHNRDCISGDEKIIVDREISDTDAELLVFDSATIRAKTDSEKLADAIITLDDYKQIKITEAKKIAGDNISSKLPDFKQRNIGNDGEAGTIKMAELTSSKYSDVTQLITPKIDNTNNDKTSLEGIYNDPSVIDISDIITPLDPSIQPYVTAYVYLKLKALAAYLLVYIVRDWENDKTASILGCNTQTEVDAIDLSDCPVLNIT